MLKFVGPVARKAWPPTSAIGALHAMVSEPHTGADNKRVRAQQSLKGAAGTTRPTGDEETDDKGAPSAASAPGINIGDTVITTWRRDKDSWDGPRATVVKLKPKKVTVSMLTGTRTGQHRDFPVKNLSPAPATAGSKRPAGCNPDIEPATKRPEPVRDGAAEALYGPLGDLPE